MLILRYSQTKGVMFLFPINNNDNNNNNEDL